MAGRVGWDGRGLLEGQKVQKSRVAPSIDDGTTPAPPTPPMSITTKRLVIAQDTCNTTAGLIDGDLTAISRIVLVEASRLSHRC